jgi:general secretion pathway protein E/type IV pilus assembly protein PilB
VRTICKECKEQYDPDPEQLPSDFKFPAGLKLSRGKGCRRCRGTGYRGRTGLFELMVTNDAMREKIMARTSSGDILSAARASGLRLLREDGWAKVIEGVTTPAEVIRCTKM